MRTAARQYPTSPGGTDLADDGEVAVAVLVVEIPTTSTSVTNGIWTGGSNGDGGSNASRTVGISYVYLRH